MSRRRGHAALAVALAACAVLLAFWAKAPAFGEEGTNNEVPADGNDRVQVFLTNTERFLADDFITWTEPGTRMNFGDSNQYGSIGVASNFTVGGQAKRAEFVSDRLEDRYWIVVDRQEGTGRYATNVTMVQSDTDGDGVEDHVEVTAVYDRTYTPRVLDENGNEVHIANVECYLDGMYGAPAWEVPFGNIKWGFQLGSGFPGSVDEETGDIILRSDSEGNPPVSVDFRLGYDLRFDLITSAWPKPSYASSPDDPNDKPVDVPPVKGDTGITSSGTLQGANIPADAEVSLEAAMVAEGEEYAALIDQVEPTMLYGMFKVDMTVNGERVHDGFGTLALSFPVDAKYEGYAFRVLHLHEDGTVTAERAFAKDGLVTVKVTDLSTFALEIGEKPEKPVADPEEEVAPKVPAKLDTAPAKADESPAALAATGDSVLVPGVLALALVGGLATMLVSRKAAKKRMG